MNNRRGFIKKLLGGSAIVAVPTVRELIAKEEKETEQRLEMDSSKNELRFYNGNSNFIGDCTSSSATVIVYDNTFYHDSIESI